MRDKWGNTHEEPIVKWSEIMRANDRLFNDFKGLYGMVNGEAQSRKQQARECFLRTGKRVPEITWDGTRELISWYSKTSSKGLHTPSECIEAKQAYGRLAQNYDQWRQDEAAKWQSELEDTNNAHLNQEVADADEFHNMF